ncbi:hypothetical protein BDK51DRAFT_24606 [Blyttiomyces helicus]|uniref:CBS domain-containing protein n=1 Tax=Blyttiomyces helicus TaxID=388810 RepID=A0A4P9VZT0_9FUNG|nr:hypothetical protein BDK51DRAFT_24606 [Blyttiomyces helicus]|eukprot:RKO83908.1 hypothetical protein BDK51DRAFT_24606 [Blyttiomyces helicus]
MQNLPTPTLPPSSRPRPDDTLLNQPRWSQVPPPVNQPQQRGFSSASSTSSISSSISLSLPPSSPSSSGLIVPPPPISTSSRHSHSVAIPPPPAPGTVAAMSPNPAVALQETARVIEAAAYMAAKRQDAVLVVDADGHLSGILTDKDCAYRVVAEGLNPRTTLVSAVMTRYPISVTTSTSASEALNKMVAGHFRHLPVEEKEDDVVGILDITKCLYEALEKLERASESSRKLDEALSTVESAACAIPTTRSSSAALRTAELLRSQLALPTLNLASLLASQAASPPVADAHATVIVAARAMRAARETAVLVFDTEDMGSLAGIFTSKDLVLRLALPPPLSPPAKWSEGEFEHTLRSRHLCPTDGRYLHLPVVDEEGVVAGMVDVLKLTYTTLTQVRTVEGWEGLLRAR